MIYEAFIKRPLDFCLSLSGLLLLSPLLIVIAVAIYISDGTPVLFRQQRVGRDRKLFYIIKFRTMAINKTAAQGSFDAGDSSRVTRVGGILRRFKLDEIPQLFNVVKGEMSLIGPRPEIDLWTRIYTEEWDAVLIARPGITDWASIMYRHEEDILSNSKDPQKTYRDVILPGKLEHYKRYVEDIRFGKDANILMQTLGSLGKRSS